MTTSLSIGRVPCGTLKTSRVRRYTSLHLHSAFVHALFQIAPIEYALCESLRTRRRHPLDRHLQAPFPHRSLPSIYCFVLLRVHVPPSSLGQHLPHQSSTFGRLYSTRRVCEETLWFIDCNTISWNRIVLLSLNFPTNSIQRTMVSVDYVYLPVPDFNLPGDRIRVRVGYLILCPEYKAFKRKPTGRHNF